MKPISTSKSIAAIGHDPETNILSIKFHNGKTYQYANVTPAHHRALVGAKSIGSHFMSHIRGNFKQVKP